jgi:hypothetical protein
MTMNELKHTPGPWRVDERILSNSVCVYTVDRKRFVADCGGLGGIPEDDELVMADARLIASAPALLEALEEILRNVAPWAKADTMAGRLAGIASAAIAKAKGGA